MAREMIGMNPAEVESIAAVARSQLQTLEAAQQAIAQARNASLNPANYGITPGGLIVAPWAIGGTTVAIGLVARANANAERLLGSLGVEVAEQRFTSATNAGSYRAIVPPWMQPDRGASAPGTAHKPWWEMLDDVFAPARTINSIIKGSGIAVAAAWMLKNVRDVRSINALRYAWEFAKAHPYSSFIDDVFKAKPLVWATRAFAVVGSVVSVAQFAYTMWWDEDATTWDKWRDGIGAGLAVAGTVMLFIPPLTAVGGAVLAVGAAWSIGTAIWDNREAIGEWVSGVASDVSRTATDVAHAVGSAVSDVAGSVTKAASNVIDAGVDFISGIGKGWGFGW